MHLRYILSSIFISLASLVSQVQAQQNYVELILDASGSMWNTLEDGSYRITAAKNVLSDFIKDLPSGDLNVGLRIYGSEKDAIDEGACEDSRLFVDLEGIDKGALQSQVDSVSARGATPIAHSLAQAAQDFPQEANKRLIILVTDGEESCGGDLQAVAQNLRAKGFEIDLKIIGFALSDKAQKSFEGIGEFINTEDASELAKALAGAVEEVVVEAESETNANPASPERGSVSLSAATSTPAGEVFEVSYEGDIEQNDYISLALLESEADIYLTYGYVRDDLSPIKLYAPFEPGDYELRYLSDRGEILTSQLLSVSPSDITLDFPKEVVAAKRFEVRWTGPNGDSDYITIVPAGAPEGDYLSYFYTAGYEQVGELIAPSEAGDYEIRYSTDRSSDKGNIFASRPIKIIPSNIAIVLEVPSEVMAGANFEVNWQGPDNERDYITIVALGAAEGAYQDYFYTSEGSPNQLTAPLETGDYEVRYSTDRGDALGQIFASQPIKIIQSQITLSAPSEVARGSEFEVRWSGPNGSSDYITIVPQGAPEGSYLSYFYTEGNNPGSLQAPDEAGDYEIRYSTDRADGYGKTFASIPIKVK
ncbi:MAG: VWA domain-containing protein [Deinococcales bacterium]